VVETDEDGHGTLLFADADVGRRLWPETNLLNCPLNMQFLGRRSLAGYRNRARACAFREFHPMRIRIVWMS
jgi:hypothetical protein